MLHTAFNKSDQANKAILCFLLLWTALNAVQAFTLELQGDEAYYWLYSRYLDWGYFDHPPMVAIFIRIGDSLMHNEFGLRLMTVLASSASVYLLWLIVKKYTSDATGFMLVISGIFIFHIYGFTTTPDAPLFLFTVLFYFFYQRYLQKDSLWLALVLALIVACLFYSKYNAVLLIGFTVASNIKLLRRWSFWLIVLLSAALYVPHILWQINHNYPSVNYHLFERSAHTYAITNTFSYLPAQLLMAGPLIGWFLFYKAFTAKISDAFIRCLMANCAGTLIFFLLSSLKGEVQPQWTFILFAPLVVLSLIGFKQKGGRPKWFLPLAVTNLSILIIVRIIIIIGFGFARTYGHLKSYYGFKEWAHLVKARAGDAYVIMSDGFQDPAKYDYYNHNLKCFAYDNFYYRRTQFDIWPMEERLQHQRIYYLNWFPIAGVTTDSLKIAAGTWYGGWVEDVRTYQKINFETTSYKVMASPGQKQEFDLTMTNPYSYPISLADSGQTHPVTLHACFMSGDSLISDQQGLDSYKKIKLKPGQKTRYRFTLHAPMQKGKYDLMFVLRTHPFAGSKNSRIVTFTVK